MPSEDNKHVGGEFEKNTQKPVNMDNLQSRDAQQVPNSASQLAAESISEKLGVNYPFPPHLEYVTCFLIHLLIVYVLELI